MYLADTILSGFFVCLFCLVCTRENQQTYDIKVVCSMSLKYTYFQSTHQKKKSLHCSQFVVSKKKKLKICTVSCTQRRTTKCSQNATCTCKCIISEEKAKYVSEL